MDLSYGDSDGALLLASFMVVAKRTSRSVAATYWNLDESAAGENK